MKRVLVAVYHFPPIGGGGVQRTLKYVKYLPHFGWKPLVLTQKGAKWEANDAELLAEIPSDMEIVRVKPWLHIWQFFPSANSTWGKIRNQFTRIVNYISIPDRAIFWCLPAIRRAVPLVAERNIDVIYTTSPPNSTHLLGYLLTRISKRPWIADFRDPWVDYPLVDRQKASSRVRLRIQAPLEARVVKSAQRIIVTTEETKHLFLRKYGALVSQKIAVIPNGFDPEDFKGLAPEKRDTGFRMVYTGSLRSLLTCMPFLQGLQKLVEEKPELKTEIRVEFFGQQKQEEISFARKAGLLDVVVKFHGYVSYKESLQKQISSDVLLLFMTILNSYGGGQLMSGKMFEYIASGKPILGILPPEGEAARLIQAENLGLVADFQNVDEIKDAIYKLYRLHMEGELKASASPELLKNYERRELTAKLAMIMDQTIGESQLTK